MGLPASKTRGAVYTPEPVSRYIANWAIRNRSDLVLEPSCGQASFLTTAAKRAASLPRSSLLDEPVLTGVELHHDSADYCRKLLAKEGIGAEIHAMDFFDFEPGELFDAIIGNPPYVRYQRFSGADRAKALRAALAQGVSLTGLASSWAAFVVHATTLLKPSGRLGFVLPAELLTVNYAAPVRQFLLSRFASIKLVTFEKRIFPDALEDVVLLLAEGNGTSTCFEVYSAHSAECLADLPEIGNWQGVCPPENGKWSSALVPGDSYTDYEHAVRSTGFVTLADWGSTYLGAVSGNNSYFALSARQADEAGIASRDLCKISPPGSRHLRGITFDRRAWEELADDQAKCFLLCPSESPSIGARDYIAKGEDAGVHNAYKCRVRKPWWRVPLVGKPDLFLTYMDAERPRLVANAAKVFHLNSLYGVQLRPGLRSIGSKCIPLASINSLTLLGAEFVGRSYGGGMLKMEPREADRLPMPPVSLLKEKSKQLQAIKPQVAAIISRGNTREAVELVDAVLFSELKDFDLGAIRKTRELLFARRKTRSEKSGKN